MHYNRNMQEKLGDRMRTMLPAGQWELLQRVAAAAAKLNLPLYVVGGLPRDLLLGHAGKDFDLVVEGPAEQLAQSLSSEYGGHVVVHRRFGTAKWEVPGAMPKPGLPAQQAGAVEALDLVTARSESYKHPGALPTVVPGTIEDDLRRRDFTINAIAIRLDGSHLGEVRDDAGGRADLREGVVRVLHQRSFLDDPTRMYRAVRYEQRYGFHIAEETLELLPGGRPGVRGLSAQRIRHELDLVLDEARAEDMLRRLGELELLGAVHPSLSYDEAVASHLRAADQAPPLALPAVPRRGLRWLLWLMGLPAADIEAINTRLHFTATLLKDLVGASTLRAEVASLVGLPPSGWYERLKDVPPAAVYAVYLVLPDAAARSVLEQYLTHWRHVRPRTTGDDLKRLGVDPGPEYQRILRELRRARLDGDIRSAEEEHTYLERLLRG
jgi:tRNA nucleotidyltransferase (CCA-adding enzyme)